MIGTKILEERKSKYNGTLRVVNTWGMGTYIQSDGLTQSGGIVESIWKSTLRHILHTKYDIQSVLILGLGGGTVAKLVRKNWPSVKITGIDIDPMMIELGKKYLGLEGCKAKIVIGDAINFLNFPKHPNHPKKFDLVVVDLYNGDQFPKKFENKNYIQLVRTILASPRSPNGESGVAIFNRLYFKEKKEEAIDFGNKLRTMFGTVEEFYPISNVMFVCMK